MKLLSLFLIFGFLALILLFVSSQKESFCILVIALLSLLCAIATIVISAIAPTEYQEVGEYNIIATQDATGSSGHCGKNYINLYSEQYVILAVGNEYNYVIWTLPTSECQFYTSDKTKVVKKQGFILSNIPLLKEAQNFYKYDIYLPFEALNTIYKIDLQ